MKLSFTVNLPLNEEQWKPLGGDNRISGGFWEKTKTLSIGINNIEIPKISKTTFLPDSQINS